MPSSIKYKPRWFSDRIQWQCEYTGVFLGVQAAGYSQPQFELMPESITTMNLDWPCYGKWLTGRRWPGGTPLYPCCSECHHSSHFSHSCHFSAASEPAPRCQHMQSSIIVLPTNTISLNHNAAATQWLYLPFSAFYIQHKTSLSFNVTAEIQFTQPKMSTYTKTLQLVLRGAYCKYEHTNRHVLRPDVNCSLLIFLSFSTGGRLLRNW